MDARKAKQATTAVALAASFLIGYEGLKNTPYFDTGNVPTVCVGHTNNVDMRRIYTMPECYSLLDKDTLVAAKAVDRLVDVPLNENEKIAYISFVFNVGEGAFAKSTMRKLLNQGRYEEACRQFPRWVYDNGVKLRGLVSRREGEMKKCLEPVPLPPPQEPQWKLALKSLLFSASSQS